MSQPPSPTSPIVASVRPSQNDQTRANRSKKPVSTNPTTATVNNPAGMAKS